MLLAAAFLRTWRLDTLPPGLLLDEAINGLAVADVYHGRFQVFFPAYAGREPLYIYSAALAMAGVGWGTFGLRLPALALSLLTLAATCALGARLFSRRVGLLAAAGLAVAFWHVQLSRNALETIGLPLFAALAFYWAYRWLCEGGAWAAALAGGLAGAVLYTYQASRFLPLAIALFVGIEWAIARFVLHQTGARPFWCWAWPMAAAFAVVALPLALDFALHPEHVTQRAREVWIFNPAVSGGRPALAWLRSLGATLSMFAWQGDQYWDRNVPGRPVFGPLSALAAAAGLVVCLRGWRRPACRLLLVWLVVMALPVTFTGKEVPSFVRTTGLIPAVFVLPALGVDAAWRRVARVGRPIVGLVFAGGLIAWAALAFAATERAYFTTWASAPGVADAYNQPLVAAARAALGFLRQERPPRAYVGLADPANTTALFLLAPGMPGQPRDVRSFDARHALVAPGGARDITVLALPAPPTLPQLQPGQIEMVRLPGQPAWPTQGAFELRPGAGAALPRALDAQVGAWVALRGYDIQAAEQDRVRLVLYWTPLRPTTRDLTFFAHLLSYRRPDQHAGSDLAAFPSRSWHGGERVVSWFDLPLGPDLAQGLYWIEVGVYDAESGRRERLLDASGRNLGERLLLGPLRISAREVPRATPQHLRTIIFGAAVRLLGYDVAPSRAAPGGPLLVTLHWQSARPVGARLKVFVHLFSPAGELVAQDDAEPRAGEYPTDAWELGEDVEDPHAISLPAELPPGTYRLTAGLYDPSTGQRLPASGAEELSPGEAILGLLRVG